MFFHTFLNPSFCEKKLAKNSPPNTMRPKRHCTTRQGKLIIFDYLELLYKGFIVAKDQLFRGNAQTLKIYATHHVPVYLKFSARWIFNRDYRKPHYQLQVNVKRKKRHSKHWTKKKGLGGGGVFLREEPQEEPCLRGGIQSLSPRPTEVESSLFLLLEEVPVLLESSPHWTTEVPETFLENHTPLACVQSLPQ